MIDKVFITNRGEISNRLDASPYQPKRLNSLKKVLNSRYEKRSLSVLCEFVKGTYNTNGDGFPYVGLENIESNTGQYLESAEEKTDFGSALKFQSNDILFPKLRPYLNKVHLARFPGYCSTEFYVLRSKYLLPEYLFAFLNSQLIVNQTSCLMTGNTLPRLQTEDVEGLLVPFVSKDIQNSVALVISESLERKSKIENIASEIILGIDSSIAIKIGFEFPKVEIQKAFAINLSNFESRLDPHFYLPNFKALIDNVRKTKNAQLGDLIEFSKETWNQKDGFEDEFPYIEISEIDLSSGKINNVSMVSISEAPSRAKMVVRTNDIIVSTTRPHRGAISLIESDKDGFIASTGFAILRNLKTDLISKEYLFYILRTQICLQQMLQRSSGGSYPAITAEEFRNIYIPIPDKAIQQEIVSDIKTFIEKAEQLKADAIRDFEIAKQKIEALILS